MPDTPEILTGLSAIAPDYDALICDVWGVVHNGREPFPAACDALRRFRATRGRVVLLTNAPRPPGDIEEMFRRIGVPEDFYDAIVTSGSAARDELEQRATRGLKSFMHLGPERDRNVYAGLPLTLTKAAGAEVVLCTGLYDDETENPGDYAAILAEMRAHDLVMLCANPDVRVPRGEKLIWCAGALAEAYQALGGAVVYYGKPHAPIYKAALAATGGARRPLAIGDGLNTDIAGANAAGLDALFVAEGLHLAELGALTGENLTRLFAAAGVRARAAIPALVW